MAIAQFKGEGTCKYARVVLHVVDRFLESRVVVWGQYDCLSLAVYGERVDQMEMEETEDMVCAISRISIVVGNIPAHATTIRPRWLLTM